MKFRRSLNTVGLFIVKEALSFCLDRWSDWQWRNEPSTRYTASSLLSLHQILLQIQTKKPCGSQLLYQTHPRRNTAAQPDPPTHEREHFNSCGSGWWTERFHRCRQVANMLYVLCSFRGLTLLSLTQLHYTSYTARQLPYIQVYKHVYSAQHIKELNSNSKQHSTTHVITRLTLLQKHLYIYRIFLLPGQGSAWLILRLVCEVDCSMQLVLILLCTLCRLASSLL